jgi:hypothetical protein
MTSENNTDNSSNIGQIRNRMAAVLRKTANLFRIHIAPKIDMHTIFNQVKEVRLRYEVA